MHGRPAEREGEPDDVGAEIADAVMVRAVIARLLVEEADAKDAEEVQAEEDDHQAGDDFQLALVGLDELAEQRGAGAEPDEHRREAEHEQDRSQDHTPPHVASARRPRR